MAVVQAWNHYGAAIGEAEFVADEWRDAPRLREGLPVEEIARIERRIAQELEHRPMHRIGAGSRDDIGEAGGAASDFGGHPAGTRSDFLHRIHIEVGECGAAHLGIARIGAIHGEYRRGPALSIDRELLRKIRSAVGVGHGARGEEQQLAEIALVQGQLRNGFARQFFSAGALTGRRFVQERKRVSGGQFEDRSRVARELNGLRAGGGDALVFDGEDVVGKGYRRECETAIFRGRRRFAVASGCQAHDSAGDGLAMVVAENAGPRPAGGLG